MAETRETLRERVVSAIADPNIGFILLVLGVLGIYVEFTSPGLIFPGIAGAILALLGLSSLSILPINWTGVALLVLALALFVLEAKFTSHGMLGIGARHRAGGNDRGIGHRADRAGTGGTSARPGRILGCHRGCSCSGRRASARQWCCWLEVAGRKDRGSTVSGIVTRYA